MVSWKATNVDNYNCLGMDLEDRFLIKVSEVQSLSSSVHSTPEKNVHSDDASRSPEFFQDFLKSCPRRELLQACFNIQKINSDLPKRKMSEKLKSSNRAAKRQDSKRPPCVKTEPACKKQSRKGDNPKWLPKCPLDFGSSKLSTICRNCACRRVLSMDESFCKRCSCYFCHSFDDNKDPSLWLACPYEFGERDICGFCHIECALQKGKVGVVDLGPSMQLDGGYCCASCGTVSGILNCWKNQLEVAKSARRLDVLCYRIYLSHRLLDGTSKFNELHEIVKDAKATLERETGPVNGTSATMVRGLVTRLSVGSDVQKLCSLAIDKANEWLANSSVVIPVHGGDSNPAACKFIFEEVTESSVVILVVNFFSAVPDNLMGYKIWYYKTRGEMPSEPLIKVIPKNQRRIPISELEPSTEYTFCVAAYIEGGEVGHFEANCFTKSMELIDLDHDPMDHKTESLSSEEHNNATMIGSSEPQFADARTLMLMAEPTKEGGSFKDMHGCSREKPDNPEGDSLLPEQQVLDLNIGVPDLNQEIMPPSDSSKGEKNSRCALENGVEDGVKDLSRSNAGHFFHTPAGKGGTTIDFLSKLQWKRAADSKKEMHECNSAHLNAGPHLQNESKGLDESFEHSVKMIRWLECEGHISQEFRLKLLTWFSMRSTTEERRVVHTFVQTLIDDPVGLAGQLVDTFSHVIFTKKPKNGFCGKLSH